MKRNNDDYEEGIWKTPTTNTGKWHEVENASNFKPSPEQIAQYEAVKRGKKLTLFKGRHRFGAPFACLVGQHRWLYTEDGSRISDKPFDGWFVKVCTKCGLVENQTPK